MPFIYNNIQQCSSKSCVDLEECEIIKLFPDLVKTLSSGSAPGIKLYSILNRSVIAA